MTFFLFFKRAYHILWTKTEKNLMVCGHIKASGMDGVNIWKGNVSEVLEQHILLP